MNAPRPLIVAIQAVLLIAFSCGALAAVDTKGYVYTPITPCRIADTRVTNTPLAAKETRTFSTNGAATQGGGACTVYPGTIPSALSINVTVDATSMGNPVQYGFLSITPEPGPGSSWMNFFGGQTVANAGVATINSDDGSFAIKTQNPANVIVDVYGYWVPSPVQVGSQDYSVQMGSLNIASGFGSTAIGRSTTASGLHSMAMGYLTTAGGVSGTAMGFNTSASGDYSTAIGSSATTSGQPGSFVYSDGSNALTENTSDHQFMIRASGGTVIYTSNFDQGTAQSTGVYLSAGGGSWGTLSDRNAKDAVQHIDGRDVLDRVVAMPLATWHYKAQNTKYRHMGPMAQDFYAAFHLGESETGIDTIDADGVALAAIQGLNAKLEKENAALKVQLDELRTAVNVLQSERAAITHTAATP